MAKLSEVVAKETPPLFWLQGFEGVNLHDARVAIGDQECSWTENFIPLGAGNLRTLYDAELLYTATETIVYDFCFNIGAQFYHALFYDDGSAEAVTADMGVPTTIAAAGTFDVVPTLPHCAQWGASGIVIITSGGYYAWDGTLYSPGDAAPAWLSGLTAPLTTIGTTHTTTSVTAVGSTTLVVNGMMVTAADIPAQTLIAAHTANTITLSQAATGSNADEALTISWMMPIGIVGTAVEVFQQRVWIVNGAQFSESAPGNGADFSTSDGGGTTKSTDGFLKTQFMSLRQSNGFLYLFGDASINVISNVQTSGSPATTTFNNQNVDPQTGLGWRDALVPYGRALCFANPTGVYALFGGAAEKISDKLDRLFEYADYNALTPTMFVTTLYGVRVLGIALNTLDPTTGITPAQQTRRNLMALWNGARWFIASQQFEALFTVTLEEEAHPHGHANDATRVFHLFSTPSDTLAKKVQTKLWQGRSNLISKTTMAAYVESVNYADAGVILTGTLDSDNRDPVPFEITSNIIWINNSGGVIQFVNDTAGLINWVSSPPGIQGKTVNQAGRRLGLTLESTSPDFAIIGLGETYNEETYFG